nr:F-box protein At5g06550-like isoform X1 [Physcomitrium patens]|eukprot:XP_024361962.1 F-box protein At5g06550-like isoform X1 [Physcomitrella patens]
MTKTKTATKFKLKYRAVDHPPHRIAEENPSVSVSEVKELCVAGKKGKKKLKRQAANLEKQARAGVPAELKRVPVAVKEMCCSEVECERVQDLAESKSRRKRKRGKPPNKDSLPNGKGAQVDIEHRGDEDEGQENQYGLQRGSHSYGIQPLGNLLLSTQGCNVRDTGLGTLQVLSDEIICDILGNLDGRDLARLALVSRAFYVFAHQDSLWRNLVLDSYKGELAFKGCWKTTYLASHALNVGKLHLPLKVKDFYSDYLFQSWLCANLEIKPEWLSADNIERRENLSVEDFIRDFEEQNKPVLLRGVMESWPALKKWDREYLLKHAGDVDFAAGPIHLKLSDYYKYADLVEEERPLYIFDSKFAEKVPQLAADYDVPIYFREDLFRILGEERPDYRWLIAGPARSGSSFHIDPNSTSAWNAVVRGAKKWVMYPPEVVPPGVFPSPDGADVATPVSITEWFMNFYGETKKRAERPIECICREGEVVFVPRGWWHIVINLEESIAITQNFVSRSNILNVLEFLSRPNSQHLVSGTKDRVNLYEKFRSRYESLYPGSVEAIKEKTEAREAAHRRAKVSIWDNAADSMTGGFKFGF